MEQHTNTLDLESAVLLLSFSETLVELLRTSPSAEQLEHIMWLRTLADKLEIKLRK